MYNIAISHLYISKIITPISLVPTLQSHYNIINCISYVVFYIPVTSFVTGNLNLISYHFLGVLHFYVLNLVTLLGETFENRLTGPHSLPAQSPRVYTRVSVDA